MESKKLTKKLIDSLQPQASDLIVWDTEIRGFGLKIAPSGRKTFVLKYRNKFGRQRKPTIGTFGAVTVDQARTIAIDWTNQVAKGMDPSAEKQAQRSQLTLNQFATLYFGSAKKRESTLAMERSYYGTHVEPSLGKLSVGDITQKDVQAWINTRSKTPGAANRTISMLSAMFNDAERQLHRPANSNPCRRIKKFPSTPKQRYLSREEMKRLEAVLDEIDQNKSMDPCIAPAIRFALLTGARKSEFLTMKWEYVDIKSRVVRLPDSKTGPRNLYLSERAIEVLDQMPRQQNNPYVFPGKKLNDHFHNLKKPFKIVLERAGIKDFRIHDLRHTHATWGVHAGLSTHVIAKTLGHTQSRTAERYAHVDDEPALAAAESIGREMYGPTSK